MLTLKKKHEEILRNEKRNTAILLQNMNLGLIEVDQNEMITLQTIVL
jgi:hypothetical protein